MLIERFAITKFGTLGRISLGNKSLYTVELPWRDNKKGESCIPTGKYRCQLHDSPKHGKTLWVLDVPERSEILIHVANGPSQLDGCIAVGEDYGWWEEKGELAVWDSEKALNELLEAVNESVELEIRNWCQ